MRRGKNKKIRWGNLKKRVGWNASIQMDKITFILSI